VLARILRSLEGAKGACPSLRTLLSFRLVCGAWATVVPPIAMKLFPRARLVVPRDVLLYCSAAFLAKTLRAFCYARNPEPIELSVGRSDACYPGELAVSAIADSPDIAAVSVVLGPSRGTVSLAHLRCTLARLLRKVSALSTNGCSIDELDEIANVFTAKAVREHGQEAPARVPCYFAHLVPRFPRLAPFVLEYALHALPARSVLTSLTLDGTPLEPYVDRAERSFAALLPPALELLSLRGVSVSARSFPSLVLGICALERVVSCDLSGAIQNLPDDACIDALRALIDKPTLRRLDLSRNWLFANEYVRDASLARAMLSSPTLERLSVSGVRIPAHVAVQLILAIPGTRLARFEISVGVHTTVISEYDVLLLSERAPESCVIVFGGRVP
jgi:hypothetical protein